MIHLLLPTHKNNYQPKILTARFTAGLVIALLVFNLFSDAIFPFFIPSVQAAGINEDELITLANNSRHEGGLGSLSKNSKLEAAAKAKAEDMFAKQYWAHFGPNGESPWQFIKGAGYSYTYAGENLAKGFITSDAVHTAWMNSATHRANIMKAEFKEVGIYVMSGTLNGEETKLVVQMFGTQKGGSDSTPPAAAKASSSSKASSSKAAVVKDTQAPTAPNITEPAIDSYVNSNSFHIKGNAEKDSQVTISNDSVELGQSIAKDGAFDYINDKDIPDGEHVLSAVSKDSSGNISPKSVEIKFKSDKTLPVIDNASFRIINFKNENIKFGIKVSDGFSGIKLVSLNNTTPVELALVDNEYTGEFTSSNIGTLTIHAQDMAGNISTATIDAPTVLGLFQEFKTSIQSNPVINQTLTENQNFFSKVQQTFNNMNLRQKTNLIITLLILIVMLVDGIIIYKKGLLFERSSSFLHIPQLAIILLVTVFTGLGTIL